MSRHTSWHVGGPAEVFFTPRDRDDLRAFLRSCPPRCPLHWVGLGSNLLVRDGGIRGVVIATHGALGASSALSETTCTAEAGVACARIARQCVKWGLGPAEFFAGIPGTLGGALAMNAGAFGGETWKHVVEVETIDRARRASTRARRPNTRSSYRSVKAPAPDEWFLGRAPELRAHARASTTAQCANCSTRRKADAAHRRMELRLGVHQSARAITPRG